MSLQDIPWRSLKALSFDIYGTLVDWDNGIIQAARASAINPYLPTSDHEVLKKLESISGSLEKTNPDWKKTAIAAESLRRYARELNTDGRIVEIEAAAEAFGASIGTYPAFDDTIEAMQRLSKHYKLIALSNIDHAALSGTLAGPLASSVPFAATYIAADIGSYKPSHANFHYLLSHLSSDFGVEKDELCHVAQSLYHDQPPARDLGIRSVWVDRYGILEERGESEEGTRAEFGFRARVTGLREVADAVDEAFAAEE